MLKINGYDDDDENDNFYSAVTQHMLLKDCLDKKHAACQRYALWAWVIRSRADVEVQVMAVHPRTTPEIQNHSKMFSGYVLLFTRANAIQRLNKNTQTRMHMTVLQRSLNS